MSSDTQTALGSTALWACSVLLLSLSRGMLEPTCMWYISSAASPTELSVRITRFPVSLEVWDDKEDDECRTEPSKFSGLQWEQRHNRAAVSFWISFWICILICEAWFFSGLALALGHLYKSNTPEKIRPNNQVHKFERSANKTKDNIVCGTTNFRIQSQVNKSQCCL